jgi:hypothetical protein
MKFYENVLCFTLTADFNCESLAGCAMPYRCQTNKGVRSGAKVCVTQVSLDGVYCKGCRERMMANGTWTEAHAKSQSELNTRIKQKKHSRLASLSVEEKEAFRARNRNRMRIFGARNRDAVNTAKRHRLAKMKLDPVKYEAFRQKVNEQRRKHRLKLKAERGRKRARPMADDDDDDDDEKSADKQSAIPRDNIIVISDDDDEVAVADDSSGSDVEGIEFVSSDDEQ